MCRFHWSGTYRPKHGRLAWLLWVLLLVLWVTPAAGQARSPDLATYEQWVREAHIAAQRGDRLGLEQVASNLIETDMVRLPDGSSVPVDNAWLREALTGSGTDLEVIAVRLGALLDALAQPEAGVPPEAQQQLQDILSRPPFAAVESEDNLIWRFFRWVLNLLDQLLGPIDVSPQAGNVIVWIFAVMGGLLLLFVVLYLLLGMRFTMTREAHADNEDDPDANLTSGEAVQQATTLARGGDYRTAVRYLYLSSLLWLDERGLLRYDRMLTNREYLERLPANSELRNRLAPIIDTFDQVWYGHAPLDAESFAAYQQQVDGLRRMRVS